MSHYKKWIEFWPILAGILALAAAAGAMQYRVTDLDKTAQKHGQSINDMQERMAHIEEAVAQLPEIRQDIKELLKRSAQ